MSSIPWAIQEKVFTDSKSKLPPRIGDIQLLILKRHSRSRKFQSVIADGRKDF